MISYKMLRSIYESSPNILQSAVRLVPFSLIAGGYYRKFISRQEIVENASLDEIASLQNQLLKNILKYAIRNVEYYSQYEDLLTMNDGFEMLRCIEPVTKQDIRENISKFVSKEFSRSDYYVSKTGGTTGGSFGVVHDNSSHSIDMAFVHRYWGLFGYKPSCRKVTIRGVSFGEDSGDVFWKFNPIYNELQVNPYRIDKNSIELIADEVERYQPQYFHGYPSSIVYLSELLKNIDRKLKVPLKAIFLVSESVTARDIAMLTDYYNVPVKSFYGHTERVIFGMECLSSTVYHSVPDYGFTEILRSGSEFPCKVGEVGELVGTGFNNYSMPLIRYRTDDYARKLDNTCNCKRNWLLFDQVASRWNYSMILSKDGGKMPLAAINSHDQALDNLGRYQFVQYERGVLEIHFVRSNVKSDSCLDKVKEMFERKVGSAIEIKVKVVPEIPLTISGKHKVFVSHVKQD